LVPEEAALRLAGRYELIRELGKGAFATVTLCQDHLRDQMPVAVKLLHSHLGSDLIASERFKREASFAAKLRHPNIISVLDFGYSAKGTPFIAMEYVDGPNLRVFAAGNGENLQLSEKVRILIGIARGLKCAHDSGLTHRDIKPDNILIDPSDIPRVTDFGVAKSAEGDLKLTRTGDCVGTPVYMSPEQFQGAPVDARSDIYCFGILAFELLTGSIPFIAETYQAMASQHLLSPMPPLSSVKAGLPSWLDECVQLCTQKDPKYRYHCMDEVLGDLERDHRGILSRLFNSQG